MKNEKTTAPEFAVAVLLKREGLPEEVKRPFRLTMGHMQSANQLLWREVAARMALDALGITPEAINVRDGMDGFKFERYRRAVMEARRWFTTRADYQDSELVFSMAGVDSVPVREAIRALPPLTTPKSLRGVGGMHDQSNSIAA